MNKITIVYLEAMLLGKKSQDQDDVPLEPSFHSLISAIAEPE